ncbi:MAG: MobA/MobL family protein [Natronohydrobacter sp.]|nr:MobA/MobL family protein [Natronohydrobacter sp.]
MTWIPNALSAESRKRLVFDFAKEHFVAAGMVVDIAIHGPGAGSDLNDHGHFMLPMREIGPDGFGLKNRDWNQNEVLDGWKAAWEAACNTALENEGSKVRVDRRSIKSRRKAAEDAAKKATDPIEKKRHLIEATRLDYIPRPHLPQTLYRAMIDKRPIPDKWADRVQAWQEAKKSKQEAHERAEAMQEALDREIEAQNVPADPHGAYNAILEPLREHMVTDTTRKITHAAIFAHDPIYDIAPILTEHFPEIKDPTDVRQVRTALGNSFTKREAVFDAIEMNDELAPGYEQLSMAIERLPKEIDPATPWANFERTLKQSFRDSRIVQTILTAVDRLASLIQSEKIAKSMADLNRTDPPPQTETKRPDVSPPEPSQSPPSSGLNM